MFGCFLFIFFCFVSVPDNNNKKENNIYVYWQTLSHNTRAEQIQSKI